MIYVNILLLTIYTCCQIHFPGIDNVSSSRTTPAGVWHSGRFDSSARHKRRILSAQRRYLFTPSVRGGFLWGFKTMSKSVYIDSALNEDAAVRELVAGQQTAFAKARGSRALALMVAEAYVTIRKIITNASPETQAAILDEHDVMAADEGTSMFTPWIKVYWGEAHLDENETFRDSDGETRRKWVPDRSMEIYHHAMESLLARGTETTDVEAVADVIMESKGASAMARERQGRINKEKRNVSEAVTENTQKLFLAETKRAIVDVAIDRPEKVGKYMTLLVRVLDGTAVEVLGVANADAKKELHKLADEQASVMRTRANARLKAEADAVRADDAPAQPNPEPMAFGPARAGEVLERIKANMAAKDQQPSGGEQAA